MRFHRWDLLHTKFTLESQRREGAMVENSLRLNVSHTRKSSPPPPSFHRPPPLPSLPSCQCMSRDVGRPRRAEKSKFTAAVVAAAAGFLRLVSVQCSSCLQSRCSSSFSLSSSSHNQPHPFESHSSCIVCVHRREEF